MNHRIIRASLCSVLAVLLSLGYGGLALANTEAAKDFWWLYALLFLGNAALHIRDMKVHHRER